MSLKDLHNRRKKKPENSMVEKYTQERHEALARISSSEKLKNAICSGQVLLAVSGPFKR